MSMSCISSLGSVRTTKLLCIEPNLNNICKENVCDMLTAHSDCSGDNISEISTAINFENVASYCPRAPNYSNKHKVGSSASSGSLDDENINLKGALPTPNVWEKRPKFQKSLSYTEWWVDMSFQFIEAQKRLPIDARDGVGQEHGCVLYPQSLESESSTKPLDIELNQNNIHKENFCHKSNARGDCSLNENGSILMPDGPIQVTYLIEVPDKSLVDKTQRKTNNQSKLLKNDCLGSHLNRAELNYSNTEQPLFESTSSSGKESVLTIYPDKLGSEFFESRDNISVCSTIIQFENLASYRLRAPKYSNRHKDGSLASFGSFDDGNIHVKESSREKEPFSLKRSNDSSVSISCKKQKLTEEIGAQVLSALSEGSISASSSLIDLNTPDLKISHIDTQKMPLTHSPADPECWLNVIVPPSDHPDEVSLNGNFTLISKHTDGNKCTLERDDAQNISFLQKQFINSDSLCNKNNASKRMNAHTDKIKDSSEFKCPFVRLDKEIVKVNDNFKISKVNHCFTPSKITGQPIKHKKLETNISLMSPSRDYIFNKSTVCGTLSSHESSAFCSSDLNNQMKKSFTLENNKSLGDFNRNDKHNSILSSPGEKKSKEVFSDLNSSSRSKFLPGPSKTKNTLKKNICVGKHIRNLNVCDISKEDILKVHTKDTISKICFDEGTGEGMGDEIKSSGILNYTENGHRYAHKTNDKNKAPNIQRGKKHHKKEYVLVMDSSSDTSLMKPVKTTKKNYRSLFLNSHKNRKCKNLTSRSHRKMSTSKEQRILSSKSAYLVKKRSKMAKNSKKHRHSFEHGFYIEAPQSEIFLGENCHSLHGDDSTIHMSSKKHIMSLSNRNDSLKRTHMPDCNLNDGMSETNTYETRKALKYNIIPCDVNKIDFSPEYTKESISKGKHIIPFESRSFTHQYAISGKPLKSDRSKHKTLRNNSEEKVTDLISEGSSVCLENNIVTKHINRPSDSGLYLFNESEHTIDKGEKQPNKQRRSNREEVEKNDQKLSEIFDHKNRTKPSTPITMISTESNSQLSKLKIKSNSDIFDVSSSEDIFTLSNKVNQNRVHASSNYSPHFAKRTKSCYLEHEKRDKLFKTFKNIRSLSVDSLKSKNCDILTSPSGGKGIISGSREKRVLLDKIVNRYAIGDKPLKSHRSKLNKLRNNSKEKVTDLISEGSSVCLENNIVTKHINRPSDSGLYLFNESEHTIDKGEKQPNKQRRSNREEVEKNDQKLSEIFDHKNRTKPSTPITMISTESNSQLSKLKIKSNSDIFDVSSSEDIFTLSNKVNQNRVHASSNYSPHFAKRTKSCYLEHEKRDKLFKTFKNIRSLSVDSLKSKNCEILTSPSVGKGIIFCSREKRVLPGKILNQYAICDKPLKSHRSKLNKLRNNSKEKVTDIMSEGSSVCLENNIVTKHTNRPSDSGLYLFTESEQSIDKGEKQPNKQRSTCEEVEKNDQKLSEILDHENRTKPSTPITMTSTESNSQLSKLKIKSNSDIFDVSSSEDIFTLSNKVNKNRVHASSNYSPHFAKLTKSCYLEHEKRDKLFKTFKNIRSLSVDSLKSKNCDILTSPSGGKGIISGSREKRVLLDKIVNRYAIGDKPLKSHRSKLNKLRNNSKEKVTDLISEGSSVCLENNIVTKHINRPSDSGLYLFNESEHTIDKGEKQPNKQRRSNREEVEKNDQKLSEIFDHKNRTKPSTPITMISTESNSQLSKLKIKSNSDIFDVSSSEDIFTLSNKVNQNRVHASSNYSPHFAKLTKSCYLEHEKRDKLFKTFKNIRSLSVDSLKSKNCDILTSPSGGKGIISGSREKRVLLDKIVNRYAIGDKPLKSHRSKLNKLRNNSKEKVTDLISEGSSVCLENNIVTKHINRPSDSGLYLFNESEHTIDKGEKQPNKQRRSNREEVEKNDQKLSEILDHENRTKPSTPITMISTESNSQLSKLNIKSNSDIFDVSSSEDIFTLSNKVNQNRVHASSNYPPHFDKPTKSCYLEHEKRDKFFKTFKNIRSLSVDSLKSKNCEILTSPSVGKGIIFCSREKRVLPGKILNQYAICDKPLKSHRSKLNKLRNNSKEKVTDIMSEGSSVCLENNIVTKHTNRPSDSGLYLFTESEQSIDRGEKQPNKQIRSTCEEVEKINQKISEILDHENRNKPSTPITMISTESNSQLSKLKFESNSDIFTDSLSSEDIFTVSKSILNKHSKKCIQASANNSSKGRLIEKQSLKIITSVPEKLTKSRYLEEEKRKEFVLALEKLYTDITNKEQSYDSSTTFVCKVKTPPVTSFHSKTEMIVDNTNSSGSKEVLDSSRGISSSQKDCKKHVERRDRIHSEDKIDLTHSSTIPSSFQNKSSDEDNFPLIQHCNRNMQNKLQNTIFKTRLSVNKSCSDVYTSQTKGNRNKVLKTKPRDVPIKQNFTSGSKTEFKISPSKKKQLCAFECFSTDEEIKPFSKAGLKHINTSSKKKKKKS